jgi:hypothetical protein
MTRWIVSSGRHARIVILTTLVVIGARGSAKANVIAANPSNYRTLIGSLTPGDTLRLQAGNYNRLPINGVTGTPAAWITIMGPTSGPAAVIQGEACCNTVQLYGCSYLAIRSLTIDGMGIDVDGINASPPSSHDILIEGCTLINLGNNQSTVAISTKTTVWNWRVRGNTILEPGTGMYFGNSDGTYPFIAGIIEGNYVKNPMGYCMEIKQQNPYTLQPGMPAGPNRTIVRNNVFLKDDRPSPSGDRPNFLVGEFPDTGPGSSDLYEVYGNFAYHNSRESLFQGAGRVVVHDNVFVDAGSDQSAIYFVDHNGPLKLAYAYNNTVYGGARGIYFANEPRQSGAIVGNLVFAGSPIGWCGGCAITAVSNNVTAPIANAGQYVTNPSITLGAMNFFPRTSCVPCAGAALDSSLFVTHADYNRDFNGSPKGAWTFRGAYAGAGVNPGWPLADGPKSGGPSGGTTDTIPPDSPANLQKR